MFFAIKLNMDQVILYTVSSETSPVQTLEEAKALGYRNIVIFCLFSFGTGVLAALMGIGGGLVMNPALIQLGISPSIAQSISVLIILLSSSSSAVQYIIGGAIRVWPDGIFFGIISLFGGYFGGKFGVWVIQKYKKVIFSFRLSLEHRNPTSCTSWS